MPDVQIPHSPRPSTWEEDRRRVLNEVQNGLLQRCLATLKRPEQLHALVHRLLSRFVSKDYIGRCAADCPTGTLVEGDTDAMACKMRLAC